MPRLPRRHPHCSRRPWPLPPPPRCCRGPYGPRAAALRMLQLCGHVIAAPRVMAAAPIARAAATAAPAPVSCAHVMAARCRPSPGPPLVAPSAIRCRRCRCRRLGSTPANNARAARQRACWRHRSATARMAAASRPPRRARRRVPDRQRAAPSPPRPPLLLCCCHRRHLRLVALLPSTRGRSLVRSTQTRAIGQGRRGLESGGAPARSSLTTCSGRPDHARRHARPRVPGASAPPRSMVAKQPTTTS